MRGVHEMRRRKVTLVTDNIDPRGNALGGHAGIVVASLVTESGLDEVIAGGGHDAGLDGEFAGIDA